MKKVNRKGPQSVKVQRRIDAALAEQKIAHKRYITAIQRKYGEKITQLETDLGLKQRSSVILHSVSEHDSQQLVDAMRSVPDIILPLKDNVKSSGFIVANWRDSWKWLTVWGSATIVGINAFYASLPPEFIDTLPDHTQSTINVIGGIALLLGRFINQSKPKALPPAENQDV